MQQFLDKCRPIAIPVGATLLATTISMMALLHFTEKVEQHLLNSDKLEPLILNSSNSSKASIWFTRYHFQTKMLKLFPIALSTNMYLIQLANSNDFIIYNPSQLTPSIKINLLQLLQEREGNLKYVIVGSQAHTMFFEDYLSSFETVKVVVSAARRNYFIKQLENKELKNRLIECRADFQSGKVVSEMLDNQQISLYQLHGTEKSVSEVVMIEKSTNSMFVTDSAQNFDSQQTMVRKPNQESLVSKIYSRICGVRNQFAIHRLIAKSVTRPQLLLSVLQAMQQEDCLVENMLVGHGVPILHSLQNMKQVYIQKWKEYL